MMSTATLAQQGLAGAAKGLRALRRRRPPLLGAGR